MDSETTHVSADQLVLLPHDASVPARVSAPLPQALMERVEEVKSHDRAENTKKARDSDWAAFDRWCEANQQVALPAAGATVAAYLIYSADLLKPSGEHTYKPSTLSRWVTSINAKHLEHEYPLPGATADVKRTLSGIRRKYVRPIRRMAPLLLNDLKKVLGAIDMQSFPAGVIGHRDSAMLVLGFAGAFRRSELTERRIRDLRLVAGSGLEVRILTSKTDQEGAGLTKALPYGANPLTCPPCAVLRWIRVLEAAPSLRPGIHDGEPRPMFHLPSGVQVPDDANGRQRAYRAARPALMKLLRESSTDEHICQRPAPELSRLEPDAFLFRPVRQGGHIGLGEMRGAVVKDTIKRRLAAVDIDPTQFGGHSLRAGFVTQALRAGATHHEIMRQTGHKNDSTVEIYRREHDNLRDNAVNRIGL
jgi:site-specific recombinase XerD